MKKSTIGLSAPHLSGLIELARGGSDEAAGELLEACRGYLLLIANRKLDQELRGKVGPSDLVQETFVNAHRGFPDFKGLTEPELLAWLRRILRNVIARARRDYQGTAKRDISKEVPLGLHNSSQGGNGGLIGQTETPRARMIRSEDAQQIKQALSRLPEHYVEIIELRNRQLLSFADIGERLSLTADSARKRWARAIARLQVELKSQSDGQADGRLA